MNRTFPRGNAAARELTTSDQQLNLYLAFDHESIVDQVKVQFNNNGDTDAYVRPVGADFDESIVVPANGSREDVFGVPEDFDPYLELYVRALKAPTNGGKLIADLAVARYR